jgi:hypothetical protein
MEVWYMKQSTTSTSICTHITHTQQQYKPDYLTLILDINTSTLIVSQIEVIKSTTALLQKETKYENTYMSTKRPPCTKVSLKAHIPYE